MPLAHAARRATSRTHSQHRTRILKDAARSCRLLMPLAVRSGWLWVGLGGDERFETVCKPECIGCPIALKGYRADRAEPFGASGPFQTGLLACRLRLVSFTTHLAKWDVNHWAGV